MASTRRMRTYRLSEEHLEMIDRIAEVHHGLSKTRVIEWAVERLHAAVTRPRRAAKAPDDRPDDE